MRTSVLAVCVVACCACAAENGENGLPGAMGLRGLQGLPGAMGERGERGLTGPQGPAGRDAVGGGYRPKFWAACSRVLDIVGTGGALAADGINESLFRYTLVLYSNDDLDVSCTVGLGTAQESTAAVYFPSVVKGAMTGGCIAGVDYPPFGIEAGIWTFEAAGGRPVATYSDRDPGHPLMGRAVPLEENDCNVLRMDDAGRWADAALADVF